MLSQLFKTDPGGRSARCLFPLFAQVPFRRYGSAILPMVAALVMMAAGAKVGLAQPNTIAYNGNSTYCPGDGCCQEFTITINQPTDTVDIVLGAYGTPAPTCSLDDVCWNGQGGGGLTFKKGWASNSSNDDFRIVDDHTGIMWNGNPAKPHFPVNLTVYICGAYDCLQQYDRWRWISYDGLTNVGQDVDLPLYEDGCLTYPNCSSGCSYITVNPYGTAEYCSSCGTEVCFNNAAGSIHSFVLKFDPPLTDPFNMCGVGGNGVACNSQANTNSVSMLDYNSSNFSYNSTTGELTVTDGPTSGDNYPNCAQVCIYIPRCDCNPGTYETISLVNPTNSGSCSSDLTSVIVDLKRTAPTSSTPSDTGQQNYPNPIDAASGFNTTIPFTTSMAGVATINIVNTKGEAIMTDDENILGPGQHFFYFSAKDLPSGTYYYTIQFPKGVLLTSRTMLLVR